MVVLPSFLPQLLLPPYHPFLHMKEWDCSTVESFCSVWATIALVFLFVIQLHGGSDHFLSSVRKIVAADGMGLAKQSGTPEEGI